MTYEETLHYLYTSIPVFQHSGASAYKPGLGTSIALDDYLGNPHKAYKTIHVAGTNGKGSVSHLLAAILRQSGFKVGLYTSPHLVDFRERIRVNGKKISQDYVVDFVERHRSFFEPLHPSFFELTSSMAFEYFRRPAGRLRGYRGRAWRSFGQYEHYHSDLEYHHEYQSGSYAILGRYGGEDSGGESRHYQKRRTRPSGGGRETLRFRPLPERGEKGRSTFPLRLEHGNAGGDRRVVDGTLEVPLRRIRRGDRRACRRGTTSQRHHGVLRPAPAPREVRR